MENIKRRTAMRQLASALGPAWADSLASSSPSMPDHSSTVAASAVLSSPTMSTSFARSDLQSDAVSRITKHESTSSASPVILGKRVRKQVEFFNPSGAYWKRHPKATNARNLHPRILSSGSSLNKRLLESMAGTRRHAKSRQQPMLGHRRQQSNDAALNDAAHASRLHPHGLSSEEFDLFQWFLSRADLDNYLRVRNTMLKLWRDSPKTSLTLARAYESTKDFGLHLGLIPHVYEFLLRSGYINFGMCSFQDGASNASHENGNGLGQSDGPNGVSQVEPQGNHISHHSIDPGRPERHGLTTRNRKTVVVIGAGIAGVAAARQLENLFRYFAWRFAPDPPPKVILIEARPRIGGRIHSMDIATPSLAPSENEKLTEHGQPQPPRRLAKHRIDMGAQIITGFENGNPMEIIVRRQMDNLSLHYLVNETCDIFDHKGSPVPKQQDVHFEAVFNQILDQACQLRVQETEPPTVVKRPNNQPKLGMRTVHTLLMDRPTLGESMDYFIESHPEFRSWTQYELSLIHWHYANLEFANATPLDRLSLKHWDQDDEYEFSGNHCMVVEGYGQIPVALSKGLDVRLNQPVSKIIRSDTVEESSTNEPVRIQCRDGTTYDCSAAVMTVPLGVLKDRQIAFSPPLPTWKEQAIQHLGFGLLNKLVLVFDRVFWDPSVELFGYAGSGKVGTTAAQYNLEAYRSYRGKFYMFWNCSIVSGLPVLVTLMAGQSAYDCESIPKEELVAEALETLGAIYPSVKPIPAPVRTFITRWSKDEFARGSYSFVGKEGTGEDYDLLAKSVDNQLYFAGEATSRHYPATAHGAYLSGIRVAKDILDSFIGHQVLGNERGSEVFKEKQNGYPSRQEKAHGLQLPLPPRRRGRASKSMVARFVAEQDY